MSARSLAFSSLAWETTLFRICGFDCNVPCETLRPHPSRLAEFIERHRLALVAAVLAGAEHRVGVLRVHIGAAAQ